MATMKKLQPRRRFDREFKEQAVQMLLDGHSAQSIADNLGIANPRLLYRWKTQFVQDAGQTAQTLEVRVRQLEDDLRCTERERDVLKKALAIFSREPRSCTS